MRKKKSAAVGCRCPANLFALNAKYGYRCMAMIIRRGVFAIAGIESKWSRPQERMPFLLLGWILLSSTAFGAPRIAIDELNAAKYSGGIVPNGEFWPGRDAIAAHTPFVGTLHLVATPMRTVPSPLEPRRLFGRETNLFPGADLTFFTVNGDLVPVTQNVIRLGSIDNGRSFWDLLVQPGRVWSERGDQYWSRAAFPFALVNSLEGETHNGIAMFAYHGSRITNVRFQVVQQTSPFLVSDDFVGSGIIPATYRVAVIEHLVTLTRKYRSARADAVPFAQWTELTALVGSHALEGFDRNVPVRSRILTGIDYRGKFYLKYCISAAGPLPWCDRARFGVWSATKALANETALLRLAQKFGPEVFDLKLVDYVPELKKQSAWRSVRFEDAINMATGIGNGSMRLHPNNSLDGYLDATYHSWYEARTAAEKIDALVRTGGVYPWGPGKVTRYRDQDMFLLGVAMNRFLQSREGPHADLWSMLESEVYQPIGIFYSPTNRTIESGGRAGQPLMAYGYYPTVSDIVKIARLYQNEGRYRGVQILYEPRVRKIMERHNYSVGFPTGMKTKFGETDYYNAFWMTAFRGRCAIQYPVMLGWGANLIALLPHGITAIRLDKADERDQETSSDPTDMAMAANRMDPFCRSRAPRSLAPQRIGQ